MSLVLRKADFCICENKAADQLCGNRTTDQRLFFFCYLDSTFPPPFFLNPKYFKSLAIFSNCATRFVSDLVGTPEVRFSQNEAHVFIKMDLKPDGVQKVVKWQKNYYRFVNDNIRKRNLTRLEVYNSVNFLLKNKIK